MTYAELLIAAADIILAHGWQKHRYHDLILDVADSSRWPLDGSNRGPHCMAGAVVRAHSQITGVSSNEHDVVAAYPQHNTAKLVTANHYQVHSAADAVRWLQAAAAREQVG